MVVNVMLGIILVLVVLVLLIVISRSRRITSSEIEAAILKGWMELKLDEKLGKISEIANNIAESHMRLENLLRVPTARGTFGELGLETILRDQLPPDMYGIREEVFEGKRPDAYIKSTVGIICIDSKFPLENFRKMVEAKDEATEKEFKKKFREDVRRHLNKIAADYVRPEFGTAGFAFAYIPSEGVHYYLLTEELDMMREFATRGVIITSPLTLAQRIELIKAGVEAKKLSEEAARIRKDLVVLNRIFGEIDRDWQTFYGHLRNAFNKARDIDDKYSRLKDEFERITKGTVSCHDAWD